ncbi:DUF1116 domain-containing protein [Pusillimonas noertemannii]|uniref:DUF1116 domain-containing protein n=1 Tax=Pusillimonas noertemannii TaxID=305977 RepID=UPI0002DD50E3|nr:DUF1116 domain-containing protein [Pusillimonas noertemannii]
MNPIHDRALAAIEACQPAWTAVRRAADCLPFPEGKTILHAGPPFRDDSISPPICNSARVAAVYEGWASGFDEAGERIRCGEIRLAPAQDFNAVVPLAAVLSPSMWVQEVKGRRESGELAAYSPLNGGSGAAMRFGLCSTQTLEHLRWLNDEFGAILCDAAKQPISLVPIARQAIAQGDDCHGRTQAATSLLSDILWETVPALQKNEACVAFLRSSPSFFLNLWMAACKVMGLAAIFPGSDVITAAGANGVEFGLQVGGMAGKWWTTPAAPPAGTLQEGYVQADALPAIGDSALVDAMGFGCMVLHHAPAQRAGLEPFMPGDSRRLGEQILLGVHKGFGELAVRTASSARLIASSGEALPIALGILDRHGKAGRLGGGVAQVPMEPIRQAVEALGEPAPGHAAIRTTA